MESFLVVRKREKKDRFSDYFSNVEKSGRLRFFHKMQRFAKFMSTNQRGMFILHAWDVIYRIGIFSNVLMGYVVIKILFIAFARTFGHCYSSHEFYDLKFNWIEVWRT